MAQIDCQQSLRFYFDRKNYFQRFLHEENLDSSKIIENEQIRTFTSSISRNVRHGLEYFVNDLRLDRNQTIFRFLKEPSVEQIVKIIGILLLSADDRICGNSAYILGSLVEIEIGLKLFLSVFSNYKTKSSVNIVPILTQLLTHPDSECTLNAAGTLGTICSSKDGRELLLEHSAIGQLIINAAQLLPSKNSWIASNAALVLARITVEDHGCELMLRHSDNQLIIEQLVDALKLDDPNRSTNAAFAIGRLIESDDGKNLLISVCGIEKLFDALALMLEANEEKGVNKNACYALSCLCTTQFGFHLCLQSLTIFYRILKAIEQILLSKEQETVWFALMCLRTISQYDQAPEHLSSSNNLVEILKEIRQHWPRQTEIQDEAKALWYIIHRQTRPNQPKIEDCRGNVVKFSWKLNVVCWSENDLQFRIFLNETVVGLTRDRFYVIRDLKPATDYNLQIQYVTAFGDGLCSEPLIFRTEEELPPSVNNLQVVRTGLTAARLSWEPPQFAGVESLKGYFVYLNEVEHEFVTDCGTTLSSLTASTTYQVDVCAATQKGRGPLSSISVTTASPGDYLPAPPSFSVIGRREIHVKWQPPETICGRLTRYELFSNGRCIYSGTDQEYRATMLKSDSDYSMEVVVITNEGRFKSRPAKARTLKDEYVHSHRPSLYETPYHHGTRMKRNETFHYSSTGSASNSLLPRVQNSNERRPSRDTFSTANRSVDYSTIRSLQLKPDTNIQSRISQSPKRTTINRSNTMTQSLVYRRTKTELTLPNTPKISAAVITPTLDINQEQTLRWATSTNPRSISRTRSYRLTALPNTSSISAATKAINRCSSTSLPDFVIN